MAGEWLKIRADFHTRPEFLRLTRILSQSEDITVFQLYKLAGWFQTHGHYGKLRYTQKHIIDMYLSHTGFADALESVGWLRVHESCCTLYGFCDASAQRKSLGRSIREKVLSAGECAACGSKEKLVVDHKTPIVRGGSCELENLQALCDSCNRQKGRKTMEEFLRDR